MSDWSILPGSVVFVIGPTTCGKSRYVMSLLGNKASLLNGPITGNLIYSYGIHSPMVNNISQQFPGALLSERLDEEILSKPEKFFNPHKLDVWIIDDLATEVYDSKQMTEMITRGAHHLRVTIIIIGHALFDGGKYRKKQHENGHYFILFKSPRSRQSIGIFARTIGVASPAKITAAYKECTQEDKYSPLIIDCRPETHPRLVLLSSILPQQYPVTVWE